MQQCTLFQWPCVAFSCQKSIKRQILLIKNIYKGKKTVIPKRRKMNVEWSLETLTEQLNIANTYRDVGDGGG